jgi:hypothetical protein
MILFLAKTIFFEWFWLKINLHFQPKLLQIYRFWLKIKIYFQPKVPFLNGFGWK